MILKKYLKEILLSVLILLNIGYYYLYFFGTNSFDNNIVIEENNNLTNDTVIISKTNETTKKYVEIKGAVKKPGVYSITNDTIINDVITMAGGLNDNAYTLNINLSKKVKDEMVIYIYTKSEYKTDTKSKTVLKTNIVYKECNCSKYDITNCTSAKESVIVQTNTTTTYIENDTSEVNSTSTVSNENTIININSATKEELMTLSGIGEAKAESIIKYRSENGNFENTSDITKVSGISDKIYEKIKDSITV